MNTGKCPKCGTVLPDVEIESILIRQKSEPHWKGVSYVCPSCKAILGVGIDPVALKTDLRKEIIDALQG